MFTNRNNFYLCYINHDSMKKNILFFYCLLVVTVVSLKAQEIRPMPADSAYGVVHISVCNMRDEGKFTSGMSTQALLGMPVKVLQYTGWV